MARKNSEKRKEKSRYAARQRRSQEADVFTEMSKLLPIPQLKVQQMDKASVIRLAICFIKLKNIASLFKMANEDDIAQLLMSQQSAEALNTSSQYAYPFFLKPLQGFVMILSKDGDIIFISENVDKFLGLNQVDLMGQTVFEYSHPCDHKEIKDILNLEFACGHELLKKGEHQIYQSEHAVPKCDFSMRMKCTLTNKGRNVNLKSASFKVVHCHGNVVSDTDKGLKSYLVLIVEPIPNPVAVPIAFGHGSFFSKHSPDMKFIHVDERISDYLGYKQKDLLGKSLSGFIHALDTTVLERCYKSLYSKGQAETECYRFLAKKGGYAWILTQATLVQDTNGSSLPQCVLCINYVISGIENEDEIVSEEQLKETNRLIASKRGPFSCLTNVIDRRQENLLVQENNLAIVKDKVTTSFNPGTDFQCVTKNIFNSLPRKDDSAQIYQPIHEDSFSPTSEEKGGEDPIDIHEPTYAPQTATNSIFAPRTSDMSAGFLMFAGDDNEISYILPDTDPQADLTHLAPEAGDNCIPIDTCNYPDLDEMDKILSEMGLLDEPTPSVMTQEKINTSRQEEICDNKSEMNESAVEPVGGNSCSMDSFSIDDCFVRVNNKILPLITSNSEDVNFENEQVDKITKPHPATSESSNDIFSVNTDSGCSVPLNLNDMSTRNLGDYMSPTNEFVNVSNSVDGANNVVGLNSSLGPNEKSSQSPLNNDPFLSFTNNRILIGNDLGVISPSRSNSPPSFYGSSSRSSNSLSPSLVSLADESQSEFGHNTKCSSFWDSPPPSSNNSSCLNDLDLCPLITEEEGIVSKTISPDDEFSLLNDDDSIWDSFINSNLAEIINSESFLPSKTVSLPSSKINDKKGSLPAPTLPLTSNLAMLLQQGLPARKGSSTAKSIAMPDKNIKTSVQNYKKGQSASSLSVQIPAGTSLYTGKGTTQSNTKRSYDSILNQSQKVQNVLHVKSNPSNNNKQNLGGANILCFNGQGNSYTSLAILGTNCYTNGSSTNVYFVTPGPITQKSQLKRPHPCTVSTNYNAKRLSNDSSKRSKLDSQLTTNGNSVLMNLLVNGEDINNGYSKNATFKETQHKQVNSQVSRTSYSDGQPHGFIDIR